jgi:hypothetical protein
MAKNRKLHDPIAAYQRQEAASRRVGNIKCWCGEARSEALKKTPQRVICAACGRRKCGKSIFDNHHPAGKSNSLATIPIPVNDHLARLNVDQYDWPPETLRNRDRDPLLAIAACKRGYEDTHAYLIDVLLASTAPMLEDLGRRLTERLGPKWWLRIGSGKRAAKR